MPLPQDNTNNIDDIYVLPQVMIGKIPDGMLYITDTPGTIHQRVLSYLFTEINLYLRDNYGAGEVFPVPFAVFLNNDETYVEPDLSVICDKMKIDNNGCHGAPDWIIEVVSQNTRRIDYYNKLYRYRTGGVREYWIVNPLNCSTLVYSFEKDIWAEIYTFTDSVKVNIFEDFSLNFNGIVQAATL